MKSICCICGKDLDPSVRHSYGLCPLHATRDLLREYDRIESLVKYAYRNSILCSITLLEWMAVLSDFRGCCACCQHYTANVIEMFNPSEGYTYFNVIPACKACSIIRRETMKKTEARIAAYLEKDRPIRLFSEMQEDHPEYE